jgi:HK97 family phage portal protein
LGLVSRALSILGLKSEGQYREGPYYLPFTGGWLPASSPWNYWQLGQDVQSGGGNAMVEACRGAYAQTVAMCPGNHWAWTEGAGRSRVTTSALTRIIRKPNEYQSISDFMLNLVYDLMDGEAFALVQRNDRFEPSALHLFNARSCFAQVAEGGDVFYSLSGNEIVEKMVGAQKLMVPARDVLHVRLHTPRHPLVGESPLVAAALQLAAGSAALEQQVIFYANQARPSFVLTTDQVLKRDQVLELRALWNEQSAGMSKGGTPILTAGLKAQPISVTSKESELAELLKLSDQAIANVYRVPLQKLGMGTTTYASTEALNSDWLASGLGFVLNHIEEAIGLLFKLKGQPDEYLEFDTSAMLRSSFKERVEGWAAGVKGGIFARNEARQEFERKPVEGGAEPWVQQQDVPLSVAYENANNPPEPPALPAPTQEPEGEEADDRTFDDLLRAIDAKTADYAQQSVH